jgi:hypothetical protein
MSLELTIPGISAKAYADGWEGPLSNADLYFWEQFQSSMGATAALRATDLATWGTGTPFTTAVLGAVEVGAEHLTFPGTTSPPSIYLRPALFEPDTITLMTVVRTSAALTGSASRPSLISWYGQIPSATGVSLSMYGAASAASAPAGRYIMHAGFDNAGTTVRVGASTPDVSDVSAWHFVAGVVEAGVGLRAYVFDPATGVVSSTTVAETRPRVKTASRSLRIGAGQDGSLLYGQNDQAFAAAANRALTLSEITACYQWEKDFLARRGIAI